MPQHDSHQWTDSFPWSLSYRWGHSALTADFDLSADTPRLLGVRRPGDPEPGPEETKTDPSLPLVDLVLLGQGTGWSRPRFTGTAIGARLKYRAHHSTCGTTPDNTTADTTGSSADSDDHVRWHRLTFELHDPATGLTAFVEYASPDGIAALRSRVRLRNDGSESVTVRSLGSLLLGGLPSPDDLSVFRARNDWLAECRWYTEPLRDSVPDVNPEAHGGTGHAAARLAGRGSWPTDGHLAMGALQHRRDDRGWLWQIESASSWVWEAGESAGRTYLALGGPTHDEHQWRQVLPPGAEFTTEWAALALGDRFEGALAALTAYRRVVRRPHPDHIRLPVIFNDYMNTLMGDPTTEKLLPLIDAAAEVGAEYFCVDAGWYDDGEGGEREGGEEARGEGGGGEGERGDGWEGGDSPGGWWDSVGAWLPSVRRFPGDGGIRVVLDRIRERGMVPGLWLEPEVVGVRSPLAAELPVEAFLRHEDGTRVTEQGRHQLDLTHPAARAHLDGTVDRLVGEWGVGYLKLDYNITTSAPAHLAHSRAWLSWLSSTLDRHPGLVIENCASGGMRMDGASLAVAQLQSTSDQQDPLRCPPIAASAPTAVPPEQGAVWAYPQPSCTDEEIAFTLGSALLGRVHLSGHLNRMTQRQLTLVRDALDTYKSIRGDLRTALPCWPLGLPGWSDDWIALGLRQPVAGAGPVYVTVWRRGGDAERSFTPTGCGPGDVRVEVLHPRATAAAARWDGSQLRVSLPDAPSVVLLRLTPARPSPGHRHSTAQSPVPALDQLPPGP
ncbi:alpha-galactosidase [Streptomyces sp. DSM 3412]|uniref:Alpha-galactosidase n=1 Tax=Streptomyces gottesmaniae TaxID=3075518 RepID=A0ABU2Z8J9_9ACTN|nr:glycoside hydrolase family 36 protein [Streptomyces sp. DSM 3412]MDT0572918.1 alpha-galactosidase [Streptomyces sp. DSM 3412]